MIKTHFQEDHPGIADDLGGCVTFLQPDSHNITKSASTAVSRETVNRFKPDKDHVAVHLVAMGSDERYSYNRNCWFAGEPVRTPSGFQPIETISEGQEVLTHLGRLRKVTKTFAEAYSGTRATIVVSNMADPVSCTGDHPLLVLPGTLTTIDILHKRSVVGGKRLRPGSDVASSRFSEASAAAEFIEASSVRPGDWVCVPTGETGKPAPDLGKYPAWVYGLFLADGCTVREYKDIASKGETKGAIFTLGSGDDSGVIPALVAYMTAAGNAATIMESYTSEEGRRITLSSQQFGRTCDDLFGKYATKKTISSAVFSLSERDKLELIAGWVDGDGCVAHAPDRCRGTVTVSTASIDLASAMQRLLASCGIPSSVTRGTNKASNGCFGSGDLPIFQLSIGASYSDRVLQFSRRIPTHGRPIAETSKARIADGKLWLRVLSVTLDEVVSSPVYNIEVEEDHSYVTTVAGHNCDGWPEAALKRYHPTFVSAGNLFREHKNKDPNKRIGIVKHSAYNDDMARVELIVWMNKKAAKGECEQARAGKELSFSMSSRMPSDCCSVCHNRARHQSLYCVHLKNHLGQYMPEMRKYAYAMNDQNLSFFDISKVKNRADRVASYLQYHFGDDMAKAASSMASMGGADLSALLGMTDDLFMPFHPWDAVTLRKVAAFTTPSVRLETLADAEIKALYNHDIRFVLGELTKRACLMDFLSFASLVLNTTPSALVKDAGFMCAAGQAGGGMMDDMCDSGGCDCGEAGDMCEPDMRGSDAIQGDSIDALMSQVEKKLGLSKQAQASRLLSDMNPFADRAAPLATTQTPVYEGVASAYKWYVTKAASHIAGIDRVNYGDFGGVLRATGEFIVGKSVDIVSSNQ